MTEYHILTNPFFVYKFILFMTINLLQFCGKDFRNVLEKNYMYTAIYFKWMKNIFKAVFFPSWLYT